MEHLLDETALFLHRVEQTSRAKRRILKRRSRLRPVFAGKQVLIVDDDVRNIFALTSAGALRMVVLYAEKRQKASRPAQPAGRHRLMDVMMPEMDGYETMKEIAKIGASAPADHRPDGQGDERRPGRSASKPAPPTTSQTCGSGSTDLSCGCGSTANRDPSFSLG